MVRQEFLSYHNFVGGLFENRGKQIVEGNVEDAELVNAETGNLDIGGSMKGSVAELGGDAAFGGDVVDSDLLIIGSGETSVGGNVDNTNISVD